MGRRGKQFAIFVLSAFLLVTASGCQLMDKLKARDRLNKGVAAYTEKKYPEAIEHFEEAIRLDPELLVASVYLATTYRTMFIPGGRSPDNDANAQKAIEVYQQVLQRDPKDTGTIAALARIYSDLEQYDTAKEWYRKRLEADPSNAEPLYGIGSTNYNLVDPRIGETGEKVKEMSPSEKAEVEQLVDEGIDALRKAMELRDKYYEAAQFLNLLYREKGKLLTEKDQKEEKENWVKEADKLARNAMQWEKERKDEEAKARKTIGGAEK